MSENMKKIISAVCGLAVYSAVSANAQIDLGVSDFPDSTANETLEQQFEKNTGSQKSFSFFDKAVNLFSSSAPSKEKKNVKT